jgi:molecular chaperone GrpE
MNDAADVPTPEPTTPVGHDERTKGADGFAVLEKLNSENAELKDRILRALADMENMRRRSEREAADARTYAVTALARDLLPVADNLGRALESAPSQALAEAGVRSFVEGVELTARELQTALGKHGIKKLEPKGDRFDPNFHQAMYEVVDDTLPAGTVTEVVQSGWKIGDRVLRPALVGISKGGPKAS